jgi:N6-L-threonylcarbamoyladenine synthase
MLTVLGIETSCDDTSVAIISNGEVLANVVSSQLKHRDLGGVVPELASRLHLTNITYVIHEALIRSKLDTLNDIDLIAYTVAPGLLGALMIGNCYAKGLALALNKPMIAVNHMEGHVLSLFLSNNKINFPFLCLTVSGGHTQIELVEDFFQRTVIGKTRDDAAGEAFDKIAKLLGLPYPGGPVIDRLARDGNPELFNFPYPNVPGFDFSFSGLKTSVLYFLQNQLKTNPLFIQQHQADICASLQNRIVNFLLDKLFLASEHYNISTLGIVGGVSANSSLRSQFLERCNQSNKQGFIPPFEYSTDNAAMIAFTAYQKYLLNPTMISNHYVVARPN